MVQPKQKTAADRTRQARRDASAHSKVGSAGSSLRPGVQAGRWIVRGVVRLQVALGWSTWLQARGKEKSHAYGLFGV